MLCYLFHGEYGSPINLTKGRISHPSEMPLPSISRPIHVTKGGHVTLIKIEFARLI